MTTAICHHKAGDTDSKHSNDLPNFRWIKTLPYNFTTSFIGTFHAFNFDKYSRHYLGGYWLRFSHHFRWLG